MIDVYMQVTGGAGTKLRVQLDDFWHVKLRLRVLLPAVEGSCFIVIRFIMKQLHEAVAAAQLHLAKNCLAQRTAGGV